jgi:predicted ATP-grasp superfamily ATP-dependent carboligase
VRAAAASAARAGFDVVAIDAYADLDCHPLARALSMSRDYGMRATAWNMATAAGNVRADAVVYLSPFENHPRAVARLARGRELWGNPPSVLQRVRDPRLLSATFRRLGFPAPVVRWNDSNGRADRNTENDLNEEWVLKPRASGGGRRVRRADGMRVPRGCYLQQRVDGTPGSVVFAAAGGQAVPLGVSRQLIGDPRFGAAGYRHCGNIMAPVTDPQFANGPAVFEHAHALARAAAAEFGLVGVNGLDFVAQDDIPYPIEINPRWTASMELVEERSGLSVFAAHLRACRHGALEVPDGAIHTTATTVGKAIVFAREDSAVADTRTWLQDPMVRDVPHPGERFRAGDPVCTVLATAADSAACYQALVTRAYRVYEQLRVPVNS